MGKPAIVLALYKVAEENQPEFFEIVRDKRVYFEENGYTTDRAATFMRSRKDTTLLLEVFEWASHEAVEQAHEDGGVRQFWDQMETLWIDGGLQLSELPEAQDHFPHFEPLNVYR